MNEGPKIGELFSRNYLRPEVKLSDSPRARRRAYSAFSDYRDAVGVDFVQAVKRALGAEYPYGSYDYDHERFWTKCEIRDFLGGITLTYRLLRPYKRDAKFLEEMREIFQQEGLHYRIDDACGVHYLVDEEFSRSTEATLEGLGAARFTGARQALEDGLQGLTAGNISGKALIRGVFEAAESVFLILVSDSNANRLNEQVVEKLLRPKLAIRYEGVPNGEDKISRVLDTFNKWVKAAHPYRHGAHFEEVHEAPLDEAVLLASIGMSFIRYMVQPVQG